METLFEKVENYAKTSFELYRLKTVSKSAKVISTFISRSLFITVFSLFMIFLNLGIAIWLGDLLGKLYLGFFCIAALYMLLAIVFYFFMHNGIKKRVSNVIISEILN